MRITHTRPFIGISGSAEWGGHDTRSTEEGGRGKGVELALGGLSPLEIAMTLIQVVPLTRVEVFLRCRP